VTDRPKPGAWVELGDVERALAELRAGDDAHSSVRATTLNLVVRCGDEEHIKTAHAVLDEIGASRPLRALVVTPSTGTPRARVSSDGESGRRGVWTERIELRGARIALPSAVVSLLVADLPVFVWWQGELPPEGDSVLREVIEMATRMIVDSDEAGLEAVARVDRMAPGLADLGWVRTAPWREAIAALFDGPGQRRALDRLVGLEVSGPPNQAALLAGWLRSRLGRELGVGSSRARRLNRVELLGADAPFVVERSGRSGHGSAHGPGLAERMVTLPIPSAAALLAGELDRLGAERPFEEALTAA
jgi:glucose-6-phosphate dehydrogenase-like protein OpcA